MDKNFDEIDNIIYDYFSDKTVPTSLENTIASAIYLKDTNTFINKMKREIIAIITAITICGGIVFAKDVQQFIKNIFAEREGIKTAVENGYILSPAMEYVEANGVKIKVDDILIDDYNLNINFNIQTDEETTSFKDLYFSSMIIYDENYNVVYCNDEKLLIEFSNKNGLNYEQNGFDNKIINSGLNYYIKSSEGNTSNVVYELSTPENNYKESNKLFIDINEIKINKESTKKGNWIMEIDLADKFRSREKIEYRQANSSNDGINLLSAVVYDTGFKVELEVKEDNREEIEKIDMLELREKMLKELEEYNKKGEDLISKEKGEDYIGPATEEYMKSFEKIYEPLSEVYIENENGEKYNVTKNEIQDNIVDRTYSKDKFKYTTICDLTTYNITDKLKLHFIYNGNINTIELEKK